MADEYRVQPSGVDDDMKTWFQEVGHESHGQVVAASEVWRVAEVYNAAANDVGVKNRKTYIVPDKYEVQVLWIHAKFTTVAGGAARQLQVAAYREDGTLIGVLGTAGATQAAATTYFYTFALGMPRDTAVVDSNTLTCPLPAGTIGREGQRLVVFDNKNINSLDDLIVAIQIAVRPVSN